MSQSLISDLTSRSNDLSFLYLCVYNILMLNFLQTASDETSLHDAALPQSEQSRLPHQLSDE